MENQKLIIATTSLTLNHLLFKSHYLHIKSTSIFTAKPNEKKNALEKNNHADSKTHQLYSSCT